MATPGPVGGDLLARRYRLIDRLGAGGMSVVWRARDELLDRLVAVKWLDTELGGDELYRNLVRREAWATARIKHPAVAAVYDYGEVFGRDGRVRAYVVMEMLDGEPLATRLRLGPMPWREATAICADIADALATAHEHGVVHRDLTPENVMLTSVGVRVYDFGIAAPVGEPDDDTTGSTFGTPTYVAPERLDGRPAQTATDVYGIGVLLHESLTGKPPFPEDEWDDTAARWPRIAPRFRDVPGLPTAIARLGRRCLAYEPVERPTAREVADRLRAYALPWWRRRIAFAAAVAALVAVAVVGIIAWWPNRAVPAGSLGTPRTPVATTGVAPTAPPTAGATTPTASPPPSGQPPAVPPPTTASDSVNDALARLRSVIDSEYASGAITRADVAQDLRQVVDSIANALIVTPGADVSTMVAGLRRKIVDRTREHTISSDGAAALDSAAAQLAAALT
jgi:serine/threonine-protein kinase